MSGWFLDEFVECEACGERLWFSPEGFVTCKCPVSENRAVSAADIERAVVDDIYSRLLDGGYHADRITAATNATLPPGAKPLTKDQVVAALRAQYDRIFKSPNSLNKRKLAATLIKRIAMSKEHELVIEYNEI